MSKLILLIDDDAEEIGIFSMAVSLAEQDYEYAYAGNMQQALQFLAGVVPAYIFVDLNMPRADGLSCVARMRRIAQLDDVPIIVYSTGADEKLFQSAIKAGANDCIKKEYTLERLSDSLMRVLNRF